MMYKTCTMTRLASSLLVVCMALGAATGPAYSQAADSASGGAKSGGEKSPLAARTAGLERHAGFLPYYWDEKKGEVLFELSPAALSREFLYFTGLSSGLGSINAFADRSSFGRDAVCRFRRVGMRVLVIEENVEFRAEHGSAELKHSVESSFPTSVLAALPIEAEENGAVLVNANSLVIRDGFDLLAQLRRPARAVGGMIVRSEAAGPSWRMDDARSVFETDHSGAFPLNTEIEALLTFTSEGEGNLNQPDPHTLSVREHHSFVALPEAGYEPREQDPRVGFFTSRFQDFSQPYDRPLERYLICRWRLKKKDPSAAISEPVKPIVFYLDRAIPEPLRSAARAKGRCGGTLHSSRRGSRMRCGWKICRKEWIRWTSGIRRFSGRIVRGEDGRSGKAVSIRERERSFMRSCNWIRIACGR